MRYLAGAAGLAALLSACGYDDATAPPAGGATTRLEQLSGEITSARYDPDTDTVIITGAPYDDGNLDGVYVRDPALDLNGFQAFRNNPAGFSPYIAYWRSSATGATQAGVVRNADYFDLGYGGSIYRRDATTTIPRQGLASYTADYVGLIAFENASGLERTQGDVRMEVDFADERMRGFVTNRVNLSTGDAMLNVVLNDSTFANGHATNGTAVSRDGAGETVESGRYEALFGGVDAAEVVGVFVLSSTVDRGALTDLRARETGIFIGTRD